MGGDRMSHNKGVRGKIGKFDQCQKLGALYKQTGHYRKLFFFAPTVKSDIFT